MRLGHIRFDAQRRGGAAAAFWRQGLLQLTTGALNFPYGLVIFRAQTAFPLGEHVANDPDAMLHVIEGDEAQVKHHHAIVEADVVASSRGDAFHEPNHIVGEITDGAGDQGREPWHADRAVARGEPPQLLDGIALQFGALAAAFDGALAAGRAKYFLRIGPGEGVARDGFAAFDAFQQEGIFGAASDAQVRAHGRQQVRRVVFVDRHQIAFFRQAAKCFEIGLNHRWDRLFSRLRGARLVLSARAKARSTAARMVSRGAGCPVQISHCARP